MPSANNIADLGHYLVSYAVSETGSTSFTIGDTQSWVIRGTIPWFLSHIYGQTYMIRSRLAEYMPTKYQLDTLNQWLQTINSNRVYQSTVGTISENLLITNSRLLDVKAAVEDGKVYQSTVATISSNLGSLIKLVTDYMPTKSVVTTMSDNIGIIKNLLGDMPDSSTVVTISENLLRLFNLIGDYMPTKSVVTTMSDNIGIIKNLLGDMPDSSTVVTISNNMLGVLSGLSDIVSAINALDFSGSGGDVLDKVLSGVDAIGSVLGGISGFLNPGEVVDGVTDVLGNIADIPDIAEGFIGDLQFDSLDALSSNISDVVQTKFPFSIPFVFNGVLLMFQASAAPPVFEFDFWGSPMVLDFSDYEGLAEFTRFFSVFFWLIGLLSVSRRFIFFGGGSDGD